MSNVNTKGLDPADVLCALYGRARTQGMDILHYRPGPLDRSEAEELLRGGFTYFDYLRGRVMKVDLRDPEGFDPRLYDRDNGPGAAQEAIDSIRACEEVKP